jgi:hypothetical protein
VASQKSKRKKRSAPSAPRAVRSTRREQRAERQAISAKEARARRPSSLSAYGERPPSPFGGLPVSEFGVFVGAIGLVVGFITGNSVALIVGFVVCALGVGEFTVREHFSGYRSHAALLAAIPAVGIEVVLAVTLNPSRRDRSLLLLAVVPVFGAVFWFLRRRFQVARQARVARRPGR